MTALRTDSIASHPHFGNAKESEEFVCWSRMQAEAGQKLEAILSRKEQERRAGGGMFCWGVGNAPAVVTSALARLGRPVVAVFSIMKGKPKSIDAAPARTVVWRRYLDSDGVEQSLPRHVLVTSRGDSSRGAKGRHFALMCWSDKPLTIERGIPFDPAAYRNVGGTGAPVGASQVTALLKRTASPSVDAPYEANLRAWLVESYWVRLTDPVELPAASIAEIAAGPSLEDDWAAFVDRIRQKPPGADLEIIPQGYLI